MRYSNLDANWMEIWGIEALTDKQNRVYGFLKPIGNQILEQDEQRRINEIRRLRDDKKNKEQLQDSSSESN